jgi:hypothetical protein
LRMFSLFALSVLLASVIVMDKDKSCCIGALLVWVCVRC